ncbi:MAG TPA: hypothetical protein VGR60_06580 [Gemmatimonadales bacterium]|nr:hypothetical protein [Gemmatimonadales bacterium]
MAAELRCFVNDRGVAVRPGASALDAVRAFDAAMAERIAAGEGHLTDGRGLPLALEAPVGTGDIIRAVISARRGGRTAEFDALP